MMNEDDLIKRYKELSENSSEKAPEGLWDTIASNLDTELVTQYQKQLDLSPATVPEGIWENIERELDSDFLAAYNAQFSANPKPISADYWDGIEMGLDADLIEQYKQQLALSQAKAPEEAWHSITQKLDIDEVWRRIVSRLIVMDKRSLWMSYASMAAAVAGLIVTVGLATYIFFGWNQQPQIAKTDLEDVREIPHSTTQEPISPVPGPTLQLPDAFHEELAPKLATIGGVPQAIPEEKNFLMQLTDSRHMYAPMASLSPGLLVMQNSNIFVGMAAAFPKEHIHGHDDDPVSLIPMPTDGDIFTLASGALGVGFSAGIKNTWLFNNQTFLAIAGYNGHRTRVSIIPDLALNFRYQAAPRLEFEAGVSFSSDVAQSYQQYIYGRFSRKDISLNYFQGEVLANIISRRSWMLWQNTIRLNSTLGMYIATLNSAKEVIAGEEFDVSNNYKNLDYGIVIGQNLDIELPGNITFSPGLRVTWGIPNIHKQLPDSPEFMWRSLNRSIEFRFAVFYTIPLGSQ